MFSAKTCGNIAIVVVAAFLLVLGIAVVHDKRHSLQAAEIPMKFPDTECIDTPDGRVCLTKHVIGYSMCIVATTSFGNTERASLSCVR